MVYQTIIIIKWKIFSMNILLFFYNRYTLHIEYSKRMNRKKYICMLGNII